MFTPAFENDDVLAAHTTSKRGRKPSELFVQLRDMPVSDTWYEVDGEVYPDAQKFRAKVYRYAKNGAGKFKVRATPEGTFIKKVSGPGSNQEVAQATPDTESEDQYDGQSDE